MPFNLGFLGSSPPPAVPSGHKGGSAGLTNAVNMIVDNRRQDEYLKRNLAQDKYAREQDFNAKVEKEQGRRREAIDAWLGAVRSGNRADVWVLGKRLNAMGINVQMPTAFSATGVPGEGEAGGASAAPGGQPLTMEPPAPTPPMSAAETKTGAAVDKLGKDTVGALGGTFEPPGAAFDAPGATDRFFDVDTGESEGRIPEVGRLGPPGTTTSGTTVANPFGPAGPTTMKAPTATWRVTDPVTGTNIEISPEEILQDQEKEIDQAFLPLLKMPGLDPMAQRAYTIGHEYAKGQIGFLTPKEAAHEGMKAADRYMTHMFQQGMVTAARLKAMKGARGGGGGGGGGASAPGGNKSRPTLANEAANRAEYKDIEATERARMAGVYKNEDWAGATKDLNKARSSNARLNAGSALASLTAFRETMTAVEARLSNADAKFYEAGGGLWNQIKRKMDYYFNKGNLTDEDGVAIQGLIDQATAFAESRKKVARDAAEASVRSDLDGRLKLGLITQEEYDVHLKAARAHIGFKDPKAKGGNAKSKSLIDKAK